MGGLLVLSPVLKDLVGMEFVNSRGDAMMEKHLFEVTTLNLCLICGVNKYLI